MKMKHLLIFMAIMVLVDACASTPATGVPSEPATLSPNIPIATSTAGNTSTKESPTMTFNPKTGDQPLLEGNVFIYETRLFIRESYPSQIALTVSGDLPTPCHQLRIAVGKPDTKNIINIDIYTVVDTNRMCAQALMPFQETIELGAFSSGHYSVWVNGKPAGEFDS